MTQIKDDGEVKHIEKIFRIVKERTVEYDSDDEEAKAERDSDKTVRRHDLCKDEYVKIYKKYRKLVQNVKNAKTFWFIIFYLLPMF